MLQGDEVRACWQAPSRPEPYEGLFRGLDPDPASVGDVVSPSGTGADRAGWMGPSGSGPGERGVPGARTWPIPVVGDGPPATVTSSGLREATHVPARPVRHQSATDASPSLDPEALGARELPTVGQGGPDGHQAGADRGVLDDPEP